MRESEDRPPLRARGGSPPISTRRVELVHGGSGTPDASRASTSIPSGKLLRPQQLQQPEEPVRIVFERRRAEQQHVPPERGDWRHRAILRLARMPGRTAQPLRLVDDEQVDARRHRLPGQLGPFDQRLERDHGAAMDVERVEAGAEVARDVGQARRIEEREHLVILAPQLAQPLHRQRLGRDDQAALDLLRVQQPVHDQRGFDGLAEADFVGEQPAHRHPRGRMFRDVQLMREQPDSPAEERSEAARFTRREQVQDVESRHEVFGARRCRPPPAARAATDRVGATAQPLGTSASLLAASRSVVPAVRENGRPGPVLRSR